MGLLRGRAGERPRCWKRGLRRGARRGAWGQAPRSSPELDKGVGPSRGDYLASGRATKASGFACSFEFLIAALPDHLGASGKEIVRGDVPEGAVEADAIVAVDKSGDDVSSLFKGSSARRVESRRT